MTGKRLYIAIVGGGLAGCEAAWQLAQRNISVRLFEMKPHKFSPAHTIPGLAELVCSNSFRSEELYSAIGLLKEEMRSLHSLFMNVADRTRIPAGKALAVDRHHFSQTITGEIANHPYIEVIRREVTSLDDPDITGALKTIITAGPLASDELAGSLAGVVGENHLYFYDAIAPIVTIDSIDMDKVFWGSRYRPEDEDYLNCPMTRKEYEEFREALLAAEKVASRNFEKEIHFEGCLPIETMAERGEQTMAFGPLKPVGLADPRTGKEAHAVVQLRAENKEKTMFNLVGFQTKLKYPEQKKVFRMIPGLEKAEFVRLGSIHRNTYVNAPNVLTEHLEIKNKPGVYLAGQLAGVEGYVESAACGLWVGLYIAGLLRDHDPAFPPRETVLGALLGHLRTKQKHFQPMNANFGLTPPLKQRANKRKRKELYAQRAQKAFSSWKEQADRL